MFNIGPLELIVLAIVALIVLGPEKLPGFARDAARMLKTLRELATGAREQLRDELGPEFADVDFRNLNPRTAITRAVFGDEPPDLQKYNPRNFDLRASAQGFMLDEDAADDLGTAPVSMTKNPSGSTANGHSANGHTANGHSVNGRSVNGHSADGAPPRPRPRPAPRPATGYDGDIT